MHKALTEFRGHSQVTKYYTYDSDGQRASKVDANGYITAYFWGGAQSLDHKEG